MHGGTMSGGGGGAQGGYKDALEVGTHRGRTLVDYDLNLAAADSFCNIV
jgi:hypothetical protein